VFPFQNQDTPELPVQGDIRNAALKDSPARKGEKPAPDSREARKNERRRERFSLDVQDLRTRAGPEPSPADRGLKVVEEVRPNGEIVLELRSSGEDGQSGAPGEKALSGGGSFEQLLARELRGDLSADIVKQAAIVLRDGGEGTIRLSLKPESLGKVKIHLEMAENKIAGRILVESEEALRAFEKEIHTLEQAFKDSGFEGASLNMALDYRNGGRGEDRRNAREGGPFFSGRFAALTYDAETADSRDAGAYGAGFGFQAVNVLA
jgi:hypothetical protein